MLPTLPKDEKIQGFKLVIARELRKCPAFPEPMPPDKFQDLREAWSVLADVLEERGDMGELDLIFMRGMANCSLETLRRVTSAYVAKWTLEYRPKTKKPSSG